MRTFIAIELAPGIKNALNEIILQLKRKEAAVRWVRPESIHLTLKFLGEIDQAQFEAVKAQLQSPAWEHSSFPLVLKGAGSFPPRSQKPRVIWAGIEPNPKLTALYEDVEHRITKIGFTREIRSFRPHLTLGRVKSPKGIQALVSALDAYQNKKFGSMLVEDFYLFRSTLHPTGAVYTKLLQVKLS